MSVTNHNVSSSLGSRPVVEQRRQHAASKLPCIALSSAISCRSSMCPGHFSTAWPVSLVVFSCRMVPSDDTRGPSIVFYAVVVPYTEPIHLSHIADYVYDFCPLSDPDVGPSVLVCGVEHTSLKNKNSTRGPLSLGGP